MTVVESQPREKNSFRKFWQIWQVALLLDRSGYSKKDLLSMFQQIDCLVAEMIAHGQLPDLPESIEVVVAGSSSLFLRNATSRQVTQDVDILEASSIVEDILSRFTGFNGSVSAYLDSLPYNFESRLSKLPTNTVYAVFLSPSIEDLAVMKLYRWNDVDRQDLLSEEFLEKVDMQLLHHLVYDPDEAAASRIAPEEDDRFLKQMRSNFEEFRKEALKAYAKTSVVQDFSAERVQQDVRDGEVHKQRESTLQGNVEQAGVRRS